LSHLLFKKGGNFPMQFQVIKVLTNHNKVYAYVASNGQAEVTATKESMFNAVRSGHTFTNASVNIQTGSIRVKGDVPREEVKLKSVKVIEILAPNSVCKPALARVRENGMSIAVSIQELERLKNDPDCDFDMMSLNTAKRINLVEYKRNIFNTEWVRHDASEDALMSLAGCIMLAYGMDALNYLNKLEKILKRGSKFASANFDECVRIIKGCLKPGQ